MDPQSLMNHLCDWVEREIAAQDVLAACVAAQEEALLAHCPELVDAATHDLEEALAAAPARARRRIELFEAFGRLWGVAPRVLTLGSIVERFDGLEASASADRLRELRADLRDAAAGLLRRQRRVAALVTTHRRITREVLDTLFGGAGADPLSREGTLVDAEA